MHCQDNLNFYQSDFKILEISASWTYFQRSKKSASPQIEFGCRFLVVRLIKVILHDSNWQTDHSGLDSIMMYLYGFGWSIVLNESKYDNYAGKQHRSTSNRSETMNSNDHESQIQHLAGHVFLIWDNFVASGRFHGYLITPSIRNVLSVCRKYLQSYSGCFGIRHSHYGAQKRQIGLDAGWARHTLQILIYQISFQGRYDGFPQ